MDKPSRREVAAYYVGMHDALLADSKERNEKVFYNKIQQKVVHAVMPEWTESDYDEFGSALYEHKKTGLLKKCMDDVTDEFIKWDKSQS